MKNKPKAYDGVMLVEVIPICKCLESDLYGRQGDQQGSQCPAMRLKMRGASGEVNEGAALCSV